VSEAFGFCVLIAYDCLTMGDEDDLQDNLNGTAKFFTRFLLGVPGQFEKEVENISRRQNGGVMSENKSTTPRRPSLVADAQIDRLVRRFAARVLFIRSDFHAGIGPRDPLPLIEAEARTFSAALALTPHGRAYWMVLLPEETKLTGDPGAALGLWIAGQTVQMAEAIEGGEPEPPIKRRTDAMLADVVARLTGEKY